MMFSSSEHDADGFVGLGDWLGDLLGRLRHIDQLLARRESIMQHYLRAVPSKRWGFGRGLLFTVAWWFVVYCIVAGIGASASSSDAEVSGALERAWGWASLLSVVMGTATVTFYNRVLRSKRDTRRQARVNAYNQPIYQQQLPVAQQIDAACHELYAYNNDYVPEDYLHTDAVSFCVQALNNRRAETLGDALNLYETELHRRRVENTQTQMVAEQQHTNRLHMMSAVLNTAVQAGQVSATNNAAAAANRAANANLSRAAATDRLTEQVRRLR